MNDVREPERVETIVIGGGPARLRRRPCLLYDLNYVDHLARVVNERLLVQDGVGKTQQRRGGVRPGRVQAGYIHDGPLLLTEGKTFEKTFAPVY